MKFGYDNARRRRIKKYAKLFVVVYGGSGLFLFCLSAWICPVFALWALRRGLWACWPSLGPVWAPVCILFVARLCTCLFVTYRSFQVNFPQIFSAFFLLKGAARDGLGDGDGLRGGHFAFEVPPPSVQQPPWEIQSQKNLFLKKLLQPLGIFFILFTCCRFLGGPRTCSGGYGKPS